MSTQRFGHLVKGVFLFAYVAFLAASISHVAYFFHSFEPASPGEVWFQEWSVPYALAVSIDVTSLVLMIGVTYMKQGVSGSKLAGVWVFIAMLTAFSWLANWEYAEQFQSAGLAKASMQTLPLSSVTVAQLNPVLASSFAFLNLAYSIVAEFFSSKPRTAEQIAAEAAQKQAMVQAIKDLEKANAQIRETKRQHRTTSVADGIQAWKGVLGTILPATTASQEAQQHAENDASEEPEGVSQAPSTGPHEQLEQSLHVLTEHPVSVSNGNREADAQRAACLDLKRSAHARIASLQAQEMLHHNADPKPYTLDPSIPIETDAFVEEETEALMEPNAEEVMEADVEEETEGSRDGEREALLHDADNTVRPSQGASSRLTRRRPLTVKEVAAALECSERRVRDLRRQGKLTASKTHPNLIASASVNAFLLGRQKKTQKAMETVR